MKNYFLVFFGGGLGASARYWLSGAVYRWLPADFPYGNLVVNTVGCFLIGILIASVEERFLMQPSIRIFLAIGILGGFTTFSSFSYETIALFRDGESFRAFLNIFSTVIGCLGATWFGMQLGRFV
ncbi:MAG: fluoride efflux transporter CrcB [Ignavibacteriales bacterium]|nr:fluoride efflux transporter CrcB [Ignavibacteriales bacterium]